VCVRPPSAGSLKAANIAKKRQKSYALRQMGGADGVFSAPNGGLAVLVSQLRFATQAALVWRQTMRANGSAAFHGIYMKGGAGVFQAA